MHTGSYGQMESALGESLHHNCVQGALFHCRKDRFLNSFVQYKEFGLVDIGQANDQRFYLIDHCCLEQFIHLHCHCFFPVPSPLRIAFVLKFRFRFTAINNSYWKERGDGRA